MHIPPIVSLSNTCIPVFETFQQGLTKGKELIQKVTKVFTIFIACLLLSHYYYTSYLIDSLKTFVCKIVYKHPRKKLLVVLTATYDHNNAFTDEIPQHSLVEPTYDVVRAKIENISDIIAMLNKIPKNRSIDALWVNAHGSSKQMNFGENSKEFITKMAEKDVATFREGFLSPECPVLTYINSHKLQVFFKKLSSKASIILYSCNTGNEEKHYSIAREISSLAKGRIVQAPTASCIDTDIRSINPLYVHFYDVEKKDITRTFKNDRIFDITKKSCFESRLEYCLNTYETLLWSVALN